MRDKIIDNLEDSGKFVEADILRKIEARRKKEVNASGEVVTEKIMDKIREDISQILMEHNLSTAIYYIEKTIESSLASVQKDLISAIQEVLDKVNGTE